MKRLLWLFAACGDNRLAASPEAGTPGDAALAPDAQVWYARVQGTVNGFGGAEVDNQSDGTSTFTNHPDVFYFDAPLGSTLVMKASFGFDPFPLSMIRGVRVEEHVRSREFFLETIEDLGNMMKQAHVSFDPGKAIVEVDFRNAKTGGYSVKLSHGNTPIEPTFGVAQGDPDYVEGKETLSGGNGTTLLLGGLALDDAVTFEAVPPDGAPPCMAEDAQGLRLEANVVTWFDFECGDATD